MTDIAAIHREILESAWSGGSQAVIDERYADDYTFDGPLDQVTGKDGERAMIAGYLATFPDLTFRVHEQLVDGDRVASRWTATGTHEGPFGELPPTGRRGEAIGGVSIARFVDGKVAEVWTMWDVHRLVGALTAPAEEAVAVP
jgi:steroid delta-isomerase-like uncharacterized protein